MAAYLPNGYTRKAFQDGTLDYGTGDAKYTAELWGEPQQVLAGIVEHNRRTRAVAGRHEHVRLVDIEASIEASGQNFSDICHLTRSGQQRIIGELVPVVVEIVKSRCQPAHGYDLYELESSKLTNRHTHKVVQFSNSELVQGTR
jgi:hypothetical protein